MYIFCRQYASRVQRPFSVRYNPYSQSVVVLDKGHKLKKAMNDIKAELTVISDAIERLLPY